MRSPVADIDIKSGAIAAKNPLRLASNNNEFDSLLNKDLHDGP